MASLRAARQDRRGILKQGLQYACNSMYFFTKSVDAPRSTVKGYRRHCLPGDARCRFPISPPAPRHALPTAGTRSRVPVRCSRFIARRCWPNGWIQVGRNSFRQAMKRIREVGRNSFRQAMRRIRASGFPGLPTRREPTPPYRVQPFSAACKTCPR
jgi:hypothetical protein